MRSLLVSTAANGASPTPGSAPAVAVPLHPAVPAREESGPHVDGERPAGVQGSGQENGLVFHSRFTGGSQAGSAPPTAHEGAGPAHRFRRGGSRY